MKVAFIKKIKNFIFWLQVSEISRKVKRARLTYLSYEKLNNLEKSIKSVQKNSIPGIFVEAGIALGGSSIIICHLINGKRCYRGYDVFGMIPSPSEKDDSKSRKRYELIKSGKSKGIGKNIYYGYIENLYEQVIKNFEEFGMQVDGEKISLCQGLFQETMSFETTDKIAWCHIDCDWYEPVRLCLEKIYPVLSLGGYIVIDDYNDYGGCRQAVDEFLTQKDDLITLKSNTNLVMVRRNN